jgi:hypothetical protein
MIGRTKSRRAARFDITLHRRDVQFIYAELNRAR